MADAIENQDVDLNNDAQETDVELEEGSDKQDQPKERRKFSPEEQLAIHKREAKKLEKQLGIADEPKPKSEERAKSSDLDYGQKAFLRSYDIKGSDELQLSRDWMNRTGDSLDSMVDDPIFQAKLGGLREARASAEAIPKSTKRATAPASDDVQTALARYRVNGEMPTDRALREKVLDAQLHHEKVGNAFSDSPIVHGGQQV